MTTQEQHQKPQPTPEEATTQLKTQLSSLFGFFSKVSTDISTSSENIKNPIALIEAKRVKKDTEKPKATETSVTTEITEKPKTPAPAVKDAVIEKPKSKQKDSRKSHRGPVLKEGVIHIDPPVEKTEKPKTPPANRFNSFKELFGSLANFMSQTTNALQSGSSKAYEKVQAGLDLNEKIKNGLTLKKKEKSVNKETTKEVKDAEARKSTLNNASKKRLEEAKRMKENFEKQLRSLDEEILLLQHGDESNAEDGTNRSRQSGEKKEKKIFRISSQKSGREHSEKNNSALINGSETKPNLPKPTSKKMLNPLNEAKIPGKKWQEGEKVLKSVASQPLYLRMEKEFEQNVVFAELEARKEKLKMKREFYKPMDDKVLREHALKYEERKKAMAHSEEKVSVPLNFAKSNAYKKVQEHDKEEKLKDEQKANEKKQLKDKQQQYAKLVKEMFFPKVEKDDLLSKENLQDIIARSQKAELPAMASTAKDSTSTNTVNTRVPLRRKRTSQDISQPVAATQQSPERGYVPYNHKDYLRKKANPKAKVAQPVLVEDERLKEHVFDFETKRGDTDEEEIVVEVKPKKKHENKGKPRMVSMSPRRKVSENDKKDSDAIKKDTVLTEEPEVVKKSYPNYLAEIRKKRMEEGGKKYGQWEKIMKSKGLSQQEKVANIMTDIDRMERQAKMKEHRIKHQKGQEPVDLEDEVGEMYLESIKAKLAIIKDLA